MQLREIHIDGFGVFNDRHFTGLGPGINVLYGPNEQGKTTLLEFIRRILFGFRVARGGNAYQPLNGGDYGGSLVIETSRGERAIIARKAGSHGGPVTVTLGSEITEGQEAVDHLLSQASAELVRNVYAFTLTELHEKDSLKEGEVKNRIYGAGLGLGRVSLTTVAKNLTDQAARLFVGKGSTQVMSGWYKQAQEVQEKITALQDSLPRYDSCLTERDRLREDRQNLHQKLQQDEAILRDLDLRLELFETWVELNHVEKELAALPLTAEISDTTFESFQTLKTEMKERRLQMEEEIQQLARLRRDAEAIQVPEAFLTKADVIEPLRQSIEQVKSASRDATALGHERDRLDAQIQADVQCIGPKWDEPRAAGFRLTESDQAQLQVFTESFSDLRKKVDAAWSKLEYHREQQAAAASNHPKTPEWLRMFVFALGGIGLAALVAGVAMVDWMAIGISLLVLGLGAALHFKTRDRAEEFVTEDATEARLTEAHAAALQEQDSLFAQWQTWLEAHDLADLTQGVPQGVEKTWTRLREIQSDILKRGDHERRLGRIEETMKEAEERVRQAAASHPDLTLGSDIVANMETVCRAWDEARASIEKRRHLELAAKEQEKKRARLTRELADQQQSMDTTLRSVDAAAEDEFEELYRRGQTRRKLMGRGRELQQLIQARVGVGADYKEFVESLHGTRPDELSARRQELAGRVKQIEDKIQDLDQQTGKLEGEAEQLIGDDSLSELYNQREAIQHQLNRCAREWAALRIAGEMLARGKRQYETTRQPAVIQAASARFSKITEGRYTQIVKRLDSEDLCVLDHQGKPKEVDELSRGTREQLYLSMRLGLIEEYESRAEPLPVVMDDVFVNFDDERKPRVLKLLEAFAANRQLLLLTCHRHSLDLCLEHGARLIEF